MRKSQHERILALAVSLAVVAGMEVQAAYINYMESFNSYTAGTALTNQMPTGPEWNAGSGTSHKLADNGKNGAGDLYILGSSVPGVLSDPESTYEFQSSDGNGPHYLGGDQPRLIYGRFLVFESDAFAKAKTVGSDYTSDNSAFSIGFSGDSAGGFEFDGDNGNVWLYRVGGNFTASTSTETFTFPANLATNEWVHLWVQIDSTAHTSQGFIRYAGGLTNTPPIALSTNRFPTGAGAEIGVGYLREIFYRTDTRNGEHGLDVDNLFVHQLEVEAIPEPTTVAMVGAAAVLWLYAIRRRN